MEKERGWSLFPPLQVNLTKSPYSVIRTKALSPCPFKTRCGKADYSRKVSANKRRGNDRIWKIANLQPVGHLGKDCPWMPGSVGAKETCLCGASLPQIPSSPAPGKACLYTGMVYCPPFSSNKMQHHQQWWHRVALAEGQREVCASHCGVLLLEYVMGA